MGIVRQMTVDFFKITLLPNSVRFDDILSQTLEIPPASRNISRDGNYYRLQEASREGNHFTGDMIKIRMQDLPVKAGLDGQVSDLDLEKNEGLGEKTAFFYHIPTQVLAIQRNRLAVSPALFANYFCKKHDGLSIELDTILEEAAMKNLHKLRSIQKFDIKIAALNNLSILKKEGQSVHGMLALSEYFQAPHISVSLSMGRTPGALDNVIAAAKKLVRITDITDQVVEKIVITGRKDDEEKTVLDLLENRLVERVNLPSDFSSRFVPFEPRRTALIRAWNKRRDEIGRMFSDDKH